jgi:peroxiredoxin Q/BCP
VAAQQKFASTHSLGYPLLSDESNAVAKSLGAYRRFLPGGMHTRRMTFVIDRDQTLLGEVSSEMQFDRHADEALAIVRAGKATA